LDNLNRVGVKEIFSEFSRIEDKFDYKLSYKVPILLCFFLFFFFIKDFFDKGEFDKAVFSKVDFEYYFSEIVRKYFFANKKNK
jgi:hypothetical protein